MSINYLVRAYVIDVHRDSPKATDSFLVDSNVWYWVAYSKAGNVSSPPQAKYYPTYVNDALKFGSCLLHCGLSFAELSHLIEETEREIYEKTYLGTKGTLLPKEYRHNLPTERSRVVSEVQAAWGLVKSLAKPMIATIDESTTDAAFCRFQTQLVDGYDLFFLEAMRSNAVTQVITDDGDFATVPNIQVFTANRNVIQAAQAQGRLVCR